MKNRKGIKPEERFAIPWKQKYADDYDLIYDPNLHGSGRSDCAPRHKLPPGKPRLKKKFGITLLVFKGHNMREGPERIANGAWVMPTVANDDVWKRGFRFDDFRIISGEEGDTVGVGWLNVVAPRRPENRASMCRHVWAGFVRAPKTDTHPDGEINVLGPIFARQQEWLGHKNGKVCYREFRHDRATVYELSGRSGGPGVLVAGREGQSVGQGWLLFEKNGELKLQDVIYRPPSNKRGGCKVLGTCSKEYDFGNPGQWYVAHVANEFIRHYEKWLKRQKPRGKAGRKRGGKKGKGRRSTAAPAMGFQAVFG